MSNNKQKQTFGTTCLNMYADEDNVSVTFLKTPFKALGCLFLRLPKVVIICFKHN